MKAVQIFAKDTLKKSDGMAVLCVLSHGLWNHVYGYDGNRVAMRDLIDCFSDEYCTQMKGKPKFVLMQTCIWVVKGMFLPNLRSSSGLLALTI